MKKLPILLLLTALPLWADTPQVTAELANRNGFVGDAILLTVRIRYEAGWQVDAVELPKTLGDASVLEADWSTPQLDPALGLQELRLEAQLAWYRLGTFKIPVIEVPSKDPDGAEVLLKSPELEIEIVNMLSEEDQSIAPSKGQVQMEVVSIWPILIGALILIIVLVVVFVRLMRASKLKLEAPKPKKPPYDEAIDALNGLTAGSLLKEGQNKAFYIEINTIIRHYIGRLFQVRAEEMTGFELEDWMRERREDEFPGAVIDLVLTFQESCDRVKFAKHDPVEAETKEVVNYAYQIVEGLKPKPEEVENVPAS